MRPSYLRRELILFHLPCCTDMFVQNRQMFLRELKAGDVWKRRGERMGIKLVTICHFTTRCHQILHTGPLPGRYQSGIIIKLSRKQIITFPKMLNFSFEVGLLLYSVFCSQVQRRTAKTTGCAQFWSLILKQLQKSESRRRTGTVICLLHIQ